MSAPLAIVTGGAKRVGAILVERLLHDGWAVVAHVHEPGDGVPAGALAVAADLSRPDCGERILGACPQAPRLLVNCAARFAPDDLAHFDPAEFGAHMAINVAAPALLTKAFAAATGEAGDRLVVNILDAKLKAPNPDFLSYTLSKAALAALTELSARALAGEGVRVNGIAPALMLQSPGQSRENFERMHAHNPLGVGVEPEHVWRALRFLLDSPVVTGEVLTLDGGQRFMGLPRDVQFLDLSPAHGAPA
jgi:NAD(P)-dependent dehydrogenase (short-subunit alcohol dehydrogenase family)